MKSFGAIMESDDMMQEQEQEQDIGVKTCKRAVKDAMQMCRFSVFCDDHQIGLKADAALKEDETLSREIYIKAYQASQTALISKPSPWSTTISQSQILPLMIWDEKFVSFDAAYLRLKDRVEAAAIPAIPRESETPT
jgi:hypothetical protein